VLKIKAVVRVSALGLAAGCVFAAPAVSAQEAGEAEVDALINASANPASAIATARSQAQAGDVTGAAATLERALLGDPNATDVRLFYAGLMCQLDDAQGARVELAKLDGQALNDQDWNATNSACGGGLVRPTAPAPGGAAGLTGEAYLGLSYDSDAFGPLAVQFETALLPAKHEDGLAAIAGLKFSGKSDGYYNGGGFYGSFNLRAKRDLSGPAQRYETGELRAGFGREVPGADYAIGGVFRHARLFNQAYVSEAGGQAQFGLGAGSGGRILLRGEVVHQSYEALGPGKLGNGWRYDLGASYEKQLGDDRWFTFGVAAELKKGKLRSNGYTGARAFAAYQMPVGEKGQYFNLSATVRYIDFKDKPPTPDRKDLRGTARAAYGIPLNSDGLTLEGAASYTARSVTNRSTNNLPLFGKIADYSSAGAELRLVWKF
jgi:Tetratricopeptide repeat